MAGGVPQTDYWEIPVLDSEWDPSVLPGQDPPLPAILRWEQVSIDQLPNGPVRPNPEYRNGPLWRGFPYPRNRVDALMCYLNAGWIDRGTFVRQLLECEVYVHVWEPPSPRTPNDAIPLPVFGSLDRVSVTFPRLVRTQLKVLRRDAHGHTTPVVNYGHSLHEEITGVEFFDTPVLDTPEIAPTEVVLPEYEPSLIEYLHQLTVEFGVLPDRPGFLHKHLLGVAQRARQNGCPFTPGELRRYSRAFALRFRTLRGQREGKPVVWPEDLRANGLTERYDAEGRVRPVPDRFGKAPEQRPDATLVAHRVLGAYAGFALGEALGLLAETGRCPDELPLRWGGLTRQLLALSESVIRAFPDEAEPEEVPNSLPVSDGTSSWWAIAAGELPSPPAEFATLLTAALPAAVAGNGRLSSGDAFPLAVARELTGSGAGGEVNLCVEFLVKVLFEHLGAPQGFDLPVSVPLRKLINHGQPPISTLADTLMSLRTDRTTEDEEQLEALGDGRSPQSVLSRALLAALKRDYDPYTALSVAVNHAGNRPLTAALTGALVGARHGLAGLPGAWVRQLGRLGLVENMAEDMYLNFARHGIWREGESDRAEWRQRYPRADS